MPIREFKIESILGGWSQTQYQTGKTEIDSSIGIDPDLAVGTQTKTSGLPVPSQYADFHGANVNSPAMWLITTPKGSTVYTYLANGRFIEYNSSLGGEVLIGTVDNSSGNGATYYNNYVYLSGNTTIARYGPLDSSAALTQDVWTSATLGSQTAMTNTTYPSLRGVTMPNHVMFAHSDFELYVSDVLEGQGILHSIKTKKGTDEGDTNNGSAYDVLDLPWGWTIADISNWGLDIALLANRTTNSNITQGNPALFFWETTDTDSFYRGPVPLPDSLGTALVNINGELKIFTGNAQGGVRISKYIGGDLISDRATDTEFLEDSLPPFSGAKDAFGSRLVFGGFTTYPENSASVWALGSKRGKLPTTLHNIIRTTSTQPTNQIVSSLKFIEQTSAAAPKVVVGWRDNDTQGLDKASASGTINSVWRTRYASVGDKFQIKEIHVPLAGVVGANSSLEVIVGIDDESSTTGLKAVNNTNFPSKRKIIYKEPELSNLIGENNFYIEFGHEGTSVLPQSLPIKVILETYSDEISS